MTSLATRLATASTRPEIVRMLEEHLRETVAPESVRIYLLRGEHQLVAADEGVPEEVSLPADLALLEELARAGCWIADSGGVAAPALAGADVLRASLGALDPHCLAAIADRSRRPMGLLVLGARASGAPYAEREIEHVLTAAGHAGHAFEIVRLAERLAERLDAERRADREIAIAREVQGKLFPAGVPRLRSLELGARCIQARSVGGDYYDFLDLGPGKVGFVLADVSGKGIHAALRMANLHAHVRSQAASAPDDPLRVLRQVNRMLVESTQPGHFATLFLGVYNDASRRLAYINCGHNPPLCLRREGGIERLEATATVLGAFEEWPCALGRLQLDPGDRLVAYSDGVTEAMRQGEVFGEDRLVELFRRHEHAAPEELVSAVLTEVQSFGAGELSDDLTLVVARVLSR